MVRVDLQAVTSGDPLLAPAANLTLSLRWAVPGGFVDAAPGDVDVERVEVSFVRVEVLRPPPAGAMREDGALAVGQLIAFTDADHDGRPDAIVGASATLVAYSPRGHGDLPPGFTTVRAAAPCDVPTRFIPVPADEVATLLVYEGYPSASLFSAPGCVDYVQGLLTEGCPAPAVVRWACRFGPGGPSCAPCLPNVFPEGATSAQCDAWRLRCVDASADPIECAAEWRVCVAGEPPAPAPCDLACACERSFEWCLERFDRDNCELKDADCDWRQASRSGP